MTYYSHTRPLLSFLHPVNTCETVPSSPTTTVSRLGACSVVAHFPDAWMILVPGGRSSLANVLPIPQTLAISEISGHKKRGGTGGWKGAAIRCPWSRCRTASCRSGSASRARCPSPCRGGARRARPAACGGCPCCPSSRGNFPPLQVAARYLGCVRLFALSVRRVRRGEVHFEAFFARDLYLWTS